MEQPRAPLTACEQGARIRLRRRSTMLSDALFESVERLDYYLAHPGWRSDCDPATVARADAIRAAMDALRGMLDTYPSSGDAMETAIRGDVGPLGTRIARMAEEGRPDTPPNLRFNPR